MSETKSVLAVSTIESSKHISYRYIEDHGEMMKFVRKLHQFVSTINCCIDRSFGK